MEETKITAKLPNLDVEITRREFLQDNAETITLRMTAVPSFETLADYLMKPGNLPLVPFGDALMGPWANPWANPWADSVLAWTRLAQAAWAPWLEPVTPRVTQHRDGEGESRDY